MNTTTFESTYAMLVRAEETKRSLSETAVYLLLILSMIFSMWEVARMRVTIPESFTPKTAQVVTMQMARA